MQRLKYEGLEFHNEHDMVETLLNQANEKLIRIDLGEFPNDQEERGYIKFRLMHIERVVTKQTMLEVRAMYNSLWSQLYRLEHQCQYTHPYLDKILGHIKNECKKHSY